ncbi:MAG: adenosine deaminase [Terriglobales bacterium]
MPNPSNFAQLPKIELHCHLDCCVRLETAAELAQEMKIEVYEPLRTALVAPELCHDLADYLMRVDLAVALMQTPESLTRIAHELVEDFAADGVIYGEVRFAPQLHRRNGLTLQQVLDEVYKGLLLGQKQFNVRTGLILCCLRHEPAELSVEVAKLAVANPDKVCALDLAGDEARYPGRPHAAAFRLAREAGLRRTVHAGEAAGPASVREALDELFAERIGHGVRVEQDPQLVERVRSQAIPLEMCPKSNVQTRAAVSLDGHPISRLLRQGVRVTVNTDARTTTETSITREFERLASWHAWGLAEFWQCQRNAAEAAFAAPAICEGLLRKITSAEAEYSPLTRPSAPRHNGSAKDVSSES